jgi:hypothetical protein
MSGALEARAALGRGQCSGFLGVPWKVGEEDVFFGCV